MAITDGLQYTQSILIGLIISFLLAKLFSIVFSSTDENLSSSASNPNVVVSSTNNEPRSDADVSKMSVGDIDDDDDDWEGVETTELDDAFCKATDFVSAIAADRSVHKKVSNNMRLKLYGLYKVATDGVCSVSQPSAIKITARAKWNAWHKLGDMSSEEAMKQYLEIITQLYPTWADGSTSMRSGGGNDETSNKDTTPLGPDCNSFVREEEFKLDAIHDHASEDQTPTHSAVDSDQTDVAEVPSSRTTDINLEDNEGQTPLHHAAVCEPEDTDVEKNAATVIHDDDGDDHDDDGTAYPSDLSSNWQSIQP